MDVVFSCLFLWPIQTLMETLYLLASQWTDKHVAITLVLLSLVVNLVVLPIYLVADRWQKEEKDLLDSMATKIAEIKAVFQGDERHLVLQTFYRQQGYHPLLSLRSSIGLLMQIPFFIAAYTLLSHEGGLKVGVWILQDLSQPDRLIHFGGLYINLLPLVMTALNLASALVYGKSHRPKDNLQLYLLAGLFLVLLYESPSGLVLYWTVNNFFSLAKNAVSRMRRPGRVLHLLVLGGIVLWALWYAAVVRKVTLPWSIGTAVTLAAAASAPWLWKRFVGALKPVDPVQMGQDRAWLRLSGLVLFLLGGFAVPLLFIAASPVDVPQPWWAVVRTALQMFSLFLMVPLGLWALGSPPVRRLLTWGWATLALSALISAFFVPPAAIFNASFTVTDPQGLWAGLPWLATLGVLAAALGTVTVLVRFRRESWGRAAWGLAAASLALVSTATALGLPAKAPASRPVAVSAQSVTPVFSLSRTGQNQFFLFIDGAPSATFPYLLDEVPGLKASLEGFTWYPNTLSYASHTLIAVAPLMGGPGFTPERINSLTGVPLKQKHDEALRTMPRIFAAAGERVVLTDPWYISFSGDPNNEPFQGLPGVQAPNLAGVHTDLYFAGHPVPGSGGGVLAFENDILARFSLFRMAPPSLRPTLYDNGDWWRADTAAHLSGFVVEGYPNLVYLPQLCQTDDGPGSAGFLFSEVFHDTGSFDARGNLHAGSVEVSSADLDRYGSVYAARTVYDGRGVMVPVARWLDWLKEQGVYDRTRIVVVADHGHPLAPGKFGPHPEFRPLILFKDYDQRGPLRTDETLKTGADVPAMLTAGFPGAVPLRSASDVPVAFDGPFMAHDQGPETFAVARKLTLTVPDSRVADHWSESAP